MKSNILILGAGPSGLALAMKLLQRPDLDIQVTVIDQNAVVGGLTGSFEYQQLYFDYGSHRLHPATAPDILRDIQGLMGADLLDRPRNGRIRLLGRFVKFPLNPLDLARYLPLSFMLGMAKDAVAKRFRPVQMSHTSFADVLLEGLGPTICETFYFPYAQKLWGLKPTEIAAVQAQKRVSANSVAKIVRKALAVVPGLKPKGAGRFFYPRRGFGQISQALAHEVERLGGTIRLSTRVEEIHLEENRPTHLRVRSNPALLAGDVPTSGSYGEEIPADFVFSTIPVTVLMGCLRPRPPANDPGGESTEPLPWHGSVLFGAGR